MLRYCSVLYLGCVTRHEEGRKAARLKGGSCRRLRKVSAKPGQWLPVASDFAKKRHYSTVIERAQFKNPYLAITAQNKSREGWIIDISDFGLPQYFYTLRGKRV